MKLVVVDAWVEYSNLVAAIWIKGESGETVMFQHERPIKLWERLLDEEALTGLYLFELAMFYGGVFYE
jgi:hypothetical protein